MRSRVFTLIIAMGLVSCTGSEDGDSTSGAATETSGTTTSSSSTSTETSSTSSDATTTTTSGSSTTTSGTTEEGSSGGTAGADPYVVTLATTLGDIVIQLDPTQAPITVDNFLAYVDAGFYDGEDGLEPTIFHRVAPGFVIQGGGLTESLSQKATMPPIVNESSNGLSNLRGRLSMARTNDPDSATSQFFVNLVDNTGLDTPPGYAVFGQVIEGLDVVDAIGALPVDGNEVPTGDPVIIEDAYRGMP